MSSKHSRTIGVRVGTGKWSEYVFDNEEEFSEDDVEQCDEGDEVDESDEFVYGTDCIYNEMDNNVKHWVPRCPNKFKPKAGMRFDSMKTAEKSYHDYAAIVGFDVRVSSKRTFPNSKELCSMYLCCNRSGFKNTGNSSGKRRTSSNRVGCKAWINIKFGGVGTYRYGRFMEVHTHDMIPKNAKHLLKSSRKMSIGHKKFMLSCAKANIGPVGSHNLLKQLVGGYCNLQVTSREFRNYKRDLMQNISGADAQMVIDKFKKKKEISSEFIFEYIVNESDQLTRMFWCDPISRRNYAAFGQAVSFDSTYGTNRYCMVFAPFTGLDNHKRSVNFGCGLLMKEDTESYVWLFEQFKRAMIKEPLLIVTDQDCAMKVAVEQVFQNTRHRLCMWHIMEKVSTKVGTSKVNEQGFRRDMGRLVWRDQLTTAQFEEGWEKFVDKYELHNNQWLKDMYQLRSFWIPTYFRDIVLGGLIKTTSISEYQNSFFGKYSNKNFSLVELMMHFDSALEKQRHDQLRNDVDSDTRAYELKTPLPLEKHASEVYTLSIFAQVQDEIHDSCFYCCVINESKGDEHIDYIIREGKDDFFDVRFTILDGFTTCSCLMFNRIGLPCCHIFAALKANGVPEIPEPLIKQRWIKGASRTLFTTELKDVFNQSAHLERMESKKSELWSAIYTCVGISQNDESKMDLMLEKMEELKNVLEDDENGMSNANTCRSEFEEYVGVGVPDDIEVHPPGKAKNKGSGKGGRPKAGKGDRIKGGKENAIATKTKESTKGKRKCRKCGQYAGHDNRNCKEMQYK